VDRILVLHEGRLVEDGTHDDLLRADGVYARLHRRQSLEERLTG
jgi:ABC-type multidrug transport system fused ATPase/permease subunit